MAEASRASRLVEPHLLFLIAALVPLVASGDGEGLDRSPASVAVSGDGRWAVTANETAGTVSLVDLREGSVAGEVAVGERPTSVAIARDGRRAVATCLRSGTLVVLDISEEGFVRVARSRPIGYEPRGVALSRGGTQAYVAISGDDAVAVVDVRSLAVVASASVGAEPWSLALTPDGSRLAVSHARAPYVSVLDANTLKTEHTVKLLGRNQRQVAVSADGAWAYVPNVVERGVPTTRENIDAGWVIGNRLNRIPIGEAGPREAIALDPRGRAVGDVESVAVSPDGRTLALAAGGTHELLLVTDGPFVAYGGPGDHIDAELLRDDTRFRRIPLGGRPASVAFADGRTIVVANWLANALQVVDASTGLIRTIPLGGPSEPSLARRGAALFHDARRSFHQWYSCHTCHAGGHTNGSSYDTLNDGRYGNPKKVLSLRGVTKTAPYTWHGWQPDLRASLENSLTKTMQGPEPSKDDLDALVAFLETVDFAPPRAPADPAAVERGRAIFAARRCERCHAPPLYTTPKVYKVGLESKDDVY